MEAGCDRASRAIEELRLQLAVDQLVADGALPLSIAFEADNGLERVLAERGGLGLGLEAVRREARQQRRQALALQRDARRYAADARRTRAVMRLDPAGPAARGDPPPAARGTPRPRPREATARRSRAEATASLDQRGAHGTRVERARQQALGELAAAAWALRRGRPHADPAGGAVHVRHDHLYPWRTSRHARARGAACAG